MLYGAGKSCKRDAVWKMLYHLPLKKKNITLWFIHSVVVGWIEYVEMSF